MNLMLEATMLICFGLSWPINTMKAYKARSAKNMSLPFILLIIFGYVAGISAKLLMNQNNYVLVVYFINLAVVTNTIPSTGIPLPFISYGGTSLVVLMAEMGTALSVSNRIEYERS